MLEPGCGKGRFLRAVKAHYPELQANGSDISWENVVLAKTAGGDISYAVASMTALPYASGWFDVALIFDVLEHLPDPAAGLYEVHRILRPGGLLHALVPCEGEPWTLHWLLWKLNLAADLKERHGGHVQRFTREGIARLVYENGFEIRSVSYSMHYLGQLKDILTYLPLEGWARGWLPHNPVYRFTMSLLWVAAYLEAHLLARVPLGAVAMHITARKP